MILSQTESSMWVDLTVVLDGHDRVVKAIFLNKATVDHSLVGVLGGSVLKWVLVLSCCHFLGCILCISISFIFNLYVDMVAISGKCS